MKRKLFIIGLFMLYAGLLYWLAIHLISKAVEESTGENVLNNIATGIQFGIIGISIYFIVVNFTAFAGLIVCWIRHDQTGIDSFKFLSVMMIIVTVVFYLVNFYL